jgi:hypothetical protein
MNTHRFKNLEEKPRNGQQLVMLRKSDGSRLYGVFCGLEENTIRIQLREYEETEICLEGISDISLVPQGRIADALNAFEKLRGVEGHLSYALSRFV